MATAADARSQEEATDRPLSFASFWSGLRHILSGWLANWTKVATVRVIPSSRVVRQPLTLPTVGFWYAGDWRAGATQVRGKDSVHPDIVRDREMNSFLAR
jgi:hypothetical protein